MSNEIDWSKAPEGATHYEPPYESGVCGAFVKTVSEGSGWRWWNGSVWQCHLGMTKERRATLIERPSKSWNGTGLPPVGTVCEGSMPAWGEYRKDWMQCRVIAHEQGSAVVIRDETVLSWCDTFRPIRTQAQIEAEERDKAIQQMVEDADYDGPTARGIYAKLYDEGYRK